MLYNHYPSKTDNIPAWSRRDVSFTDLKPVFNAYSQQSFPSKEANRLFNLVAWKDWEEPRRTWNVDSIEVLLLDHDSKGATVPVDAALQRLGPGLDYIAYSTYSNSAARLAYRLLIPLSRPVSGPVYKFMVKAIVRQFPQGAFDKQCSDACRIYYAPCVSGSGDDFTWFRCAESGAAIDVAPFQRLQAQQNSIAKMQQRLQRPKKADRDPAETERRVKEALASIPADDYATWSKVMLAIKHWRGEAGWSIFADWSRKSGKFRERDDRRAFQACKPSGRITIASIIAGKV
jgi:hypothetical protein